MCLKDEESVHHLMIHYLFSSGVWIAILAMFGIQWVMPKIVDYLFHQWQSRYKYGHGKFLWKLVLYATLWKRKLWLKKNNIELQNKSNSVDEVVQSAVWSVSEWVRKIKGV